MLENEVSVQIVDAAAATPGEWLRTYRPAPRTYITAACVGATVGQYPAIADHLTRRRLRLRPPRSARSLASTCWPTSSQPTRAADPHRRAHAALGCADASGEEFSFTLKRFSRFSLV